MREIMVWGGMSKTHVVHDSRLFLVVLALCLKMESKRSLYRPAQVQDNVGQKKTR